MKEYDKDVRPAGETLSKVQREFCINVLTAFLKAGVPLNKLDHFHEVLEEHAYKLADRCGMYNLIPFMLAYRSRSTLKLQLEGKAFQQSSMAQQG